MRQQQLEKEMARRGVERYRNRREKAEAHGLASTTPAGQWLLQNAVDLLSRELAVWRATARMRPGRRHRALAYFDLLPLEVIAALVSRCILDSVSHQKVFTTAAMAIASVLEDEVRYIALAESDPGLWKHLRRQVDRYGSYRLKRRVIVGTMKRLEHPFIKWKPSDKLQIGTVAIELFAQATGLVEVQNRQTIFGKTRTEVVASDEAKRWLDAAHARNELLTPVYLPCLEPPRPWTSPSNGGFHTTDLHRRCLIKSFDKSYLEELEVTPMAELYAAVNTIQGTKFTVNTWVLDVLEHYWSRSIEIEGLPVRYERELPPRPSGIEDDLEIRKAWRREASKVHQYNAGIRAERLMLAKVLNLANKYRGEPMYFVAQLDWRSRCYATSFHLHPQGPDYVRGLLMFGEGKPLTTPEAVRWFKIHGANCHGETKSSFDERVAWVDKMDPVICQIADDPYTHQQWQSADDPWQFLGWCREYAAWKEQGEAFESRVPVALDATQSGLQVLSMLLRDPVGASATNCVPSERPQDLYQRIADQVNDLLRAEDSEVSRMWLTFGVDRTTVKRIAMTRVYNSQLYSAMGYVREWAIERVGSEEALPTENDYSACLYLARQIWTAMDSVIAGAQQAMDWFGKVADICVANEISIRWTTPIGYTVKQDYRKYRSRSVKTRIGDEIRQHKLREDTEKFDSMKMRNALAPNVVHSLDASLMYLTANLVSSRGVGSLAVVHDSFATHAADTEVLAQSIRESAADMFTEDLLAEFKHEVETLLPAGVVLPELPPYGSLDPGAVRDSHYFFN